MEVEKVMSSITRKLSAFGHLVELSTVNRWFTAAILGFLFFVQNYAVNFDLLKLFGAFLGLWLVLCYVMAINDCFDVEDDKLKSKITGKKLVVSVEISFRDALALSLAMLIVGLLVSWFISYSFFLIILAIVILSSLYSVPPVRYKRIFPFSTIGESIGAFLPFLSGYAILGSLDVKAIVVSVVFGLVTIHWRFFHESRFYEVDQKTGKSTFAVAYGPKTTLLVGRACLIFSLIESLLLFIFAWISPNFFFFLIIYFIFTSSPWYWIKSLKHVRNLIDALWGVIFIAIIIIASTT